MINNAIKRAEFKLQEHRSLGVKSNLSILEVAYLMDVIRTGQEQKRFENQSSLFFNFGLN